MELPIPICYYYYNIIWSTGIFHNNSMPYFIESHIEGCWVEYRNWMPSMPLFLYLFWGRWYMNCNTEHRYELMKFSLCNQEIQPFLVGVSLWLKGKYTAQNNVIIRQVQTQLKMFISVVKCLNWNWVFKVYWTRWLYFNVSHKEKTLAVDTASYYENNQWLPPEAILFDKYTSNQTCAKI